MCRFLWCLLSCVLFFFSSRRRHTRCALVTGVQTCALPIFFSTQILRILWAEMPTRPWKVIPAAFAISLYLLNFSCSRLPVALPASGTEIGRASCRERVCQYV